jgi:sigma-E factor negative regulatory protein RseC
MVKFKIVEEVGLVKRIKGAYAVVSIPRKSACEGCTLKTCSPSENMMEIEAFNPLHAHVGQRVRIVMKPYTYLKGSIMVYGIPAVALIAGAVIGREIIGTFFSWQDPDTVSAVTGISAFLISFLTVKFWSSKLTKKADTKPIIEEVLD